MLEEEGKLDSSGQFTLDPGRMRKAHLNLLEGTPDLYLCKIFQALVRAGVEQVEINVSRRAVEFQWDKSDIGPQLESALLLASARADLKLDRQPNSLRIATSKWSVRKWPEFSQFRSRLGFQPLLVTINGTATARSLPGDLATQTVLCQGGPGIGMESTPAARYSQYINLNANFAVNSAARSGKIVQFLDDVLVVVRDGLPVYQSHSWLDKIGIFMAVANDNIATDASGMRLIEGNELDQLVTQSRQDVKRFLCALYEENPDAANDQLETALRYFHSMPG